MTRPAFLAISKTKGRLHKGCFAVPRPFLGYPRICQIASGARRDGREDVSKIHFYVKDIYEYPTLLATHGFSPNY